MNDKRKMMVVGGLGLVLVCVGVFQFSGMGQGGELEDPTAKKSSKGAKATEGAVNAGGKEGEAQKVQLDPQREALMAMVTGPLPKRDPFMMASFTTAGNSTLQPPANKIVPEGTKRPDSPPAAPPVNKVTRAPRRASSDNGVSIPPMNPLPGNANPGLPPSTDAGMLTTPGKPVRNVGEFAYSVKGVVVGSKPMAVFEDDDGNQRLVPLGGSVDGDSKVVGIERGKVRIRHRGKDKTLTLSEGQ
ncbi:MAG: hypothetical protein KIT11_06460 [Fimbriimonadaceae bacterium]|nr:hypothetical protein [Fimbriimonadaceae bacterium]QYK55999.1 MAG: hypothetical protein KF733_00650 [Fimbriimonadaceae bacterium]